MQRGSKLAFAGILALAACAHRSAEEDESSSIPDDAAARQARENAALRRRIEMLEDRVLYLEQGGGATKSDGDDVSAYSLPDGRVLPIVKLDAPGSAEPPREVARPAPAPEPEPPRSRSRSRPRSRGTTLARAPEPPPELEAEGWDVPEEPRRLDAGATLASSNGEPKSYRLVGARLVELTQAGGPKAPDRAPKGKKARGVVAEYEAAMAVYQAGALGDAEAAFDAFARAHPRHDYADNALYWKGEAAYDQAHYADALAAFTEVVERYGGGNKAADALLKIGLCYRELGDADNARDVLTQLIDAYPGERASDIARVKLAEFGI